MFSYARKSYTPAPGYPNGLVYSVRVGCMVVVSEIFPKISCYQKMLKHQIQPRCFYYFPTKYKLCFSDV